MISFKVFVSENKLEHEHIRNELGNKGINVHDFHPSTTGKTHVDVTGDEDVFQKANEHLKKLGFDKEYHAVHKAQKIGASPAWNKTSGVTWQGD